MTDDDQITARPSGRWASGFLQSVNHDHDAPADKTEADLAYMRGKVVDRRPVRLEAHLPNSFGEVTLHVFDHAEEQPIMRGSDEIGVVFLFRCTKRGDLRRWGCEYTDNDLRRLRARRP